jgi:photosynthetic reaction center cytochrome c subunit
MIIITRLWHHAPLALAALALAACDRPPIDSVQLGYRGVALEQNFNPRRVAETAAYNKAPAPLPPVEAGPPAPPGTWKNVQVLGGLSQAEFNRTMIALTQWVAPKQGCIYCHNAANFASDSIYAKVVARRMLQMTQHINSQYTGHVQQTGVTCYTCHRGNPVPQNIWFFGDRYQPLRHYLDRQDFRVQSHIPLPNPDSNRSSIKQTEYAYALMLNMSTGLGVNCTYCHNSRQWNDWSQSSPKRIIALRGIRMARDLNSNYLVPLQSVFPANRLGPHGDGPKLQCSTCHNGVYKPLYGAAMAKDYPALYPAAGGAAPSASAGEAAPAQDSSGSMHTTAATASTLSVPGTGAAPAAPATRTETRTTDGFGAMGGKGPSGKQAETVRVTKP